MQFPSTGALGHAHVEVRLTSRSQEYFAAPRRASRSEARGRQEGSGLDSPADAVATIALPESDARDEKRRRQGRHADRESANPRLSCTGRQAVRHAAGSRCAPASGTAAGPTVSARDAPVGRHESGGSSPAGSAPRDALLRTDGRQVAAGSCGRTWRRDHGTSTSRSDGSHTSKVDEARLSHRFPRAPLACCAMRGVAALHAYLAGREHRRLAGYDIGERRTPRATIRTR